ncbi:MAG: selenoneine biosynthesis selenosugar synthase SenB [Deltaproteobacteria bacterium]
MRLRIITPAPRGARTGNRVTARRWATLLRSLGHRVSVETEYLGGPVDALIALHAHRSHPSVRAFRDRFPSAPLIVGLAGTDLYGDLANGSAAALESISLADRLVVLQPLALEALPSALRRKARVIRQSAAPPRHLGTAPGFDVCVIGHLRSVKDPFRAALASRRLPPRSRLRILHFGGALEPNLALRARREERENPRYRWLGERPRWETLRRLARSKALVLSSRSEGGANVISEAMVVGTPVLASRIPGSVGLLGRSYPGYFEAGDTEELAKLLDRIERDATFRGRLGDHCRRLRPLFSPARERAAWQNLLGEL